MEKISFKLEVFEGPLDLLLHLISKNKVNIYDIPIATITDQYMDALETMKEMDLEVSSEFTVLASQLLLIKSRMLLPRSEETDEDDPRTELVERLLEYQRYKATMEFLKEHENAYKYMLFKEPEDIEPATEPDTTIYPVDMLISAFNDILERSKRRVPPPRKTFESIVQREKVSVKDKVVYLQDLVKNGNKVLFTNVFDGMYTKPELVATFLALLELIKMNQIKAVYSRDKNDFLISAV